MTKKILFNGGLALFLAYCYFYVAVGAPAEVPNQLSGVTWTRILIILLEFTLILNIIKIIRSESKTGQKNEVSAKFELKSLLTNKLLIGVIALFAYALILDYSGFILGTILFCIAYIRLLGEKRIPRLILFSIVISLVLYFLFQMGLDIRLPRGVGPLRDFALMLETL